MRQKAMVLGLVLFAGCLTSFGDDKPGPVENGRLSTRSCLKRGGEVIGSGGGDTVFLPEFRCPETDDPPIGRIESEEGEPTATEGAVCCLK